MNSSIGSRREKPWRICAGGKIVADLAPPGAAFTEAARAAAERIRSRRGGVALGGAKIADLIREGRT